MKDWKTLPEFQDFCRAPQQTEDQYRRNKAIYIAIKLGARQSDIAKAYQITSTRVDTIVQSVKRSILDGGYRSRQHMPAFIDFESNLNKERYQRNKAIYLAYRSGVSSHELAQQWGFANVKCITNIIYRLKARFRALVVFGVLALGAPAYADTIKAPSIQVDGETVTPIELLGEVRDKRAHWYTPRLGRKYYIYKVAESNVLYLSDEKLRVVYDKRSWPTKHPIFYGSWEFGKAAAVGAISTGVWRR